VGSARLGTNRLERLAVPAETLMQAFTFTHTAPTLEFLLAVTEPPPFTLSASLAEGQAADLQQGSTNVTIKVSVARREGVQGSVQIGLFKPPPGIDARSLTLPADKSEGALTVAVTRQAPAGLRQNLVLSGTLRVGKDAHVRYAPAIPVRVTAAPQRP